MRNDGRPIIACSSGSKENCAISVIRISGFDDLSQLQPYFKCSLQSLSPRKMVTNIVCDHKKDLDSVLLTYFKSPKSYTGENIVEIYAHGSTFNVNQILSLFTRDQVFFQAVPGEFTYRAHKNGKISLSQVEGLELFLNAVNPVASQTGFSLLQGELNQKYLQLRDLYLDVKRSLELLIDFSEDVGEEHAQKELLAHGQAFLDDIFALRSRCQSNISAVINPKVVLYGETNAGKSFFFNKLLGHDRAIVSDEHGTTRDYISEDIFIENVAFTFIDTAGIRGTDFSVEREGINRSHKLIENAFFRILVINPLLDPKEVAIDDCDFIVFTHCDLPIGLKAAQDFVYVTPLQCPYIFSMAGPIGPADKIAPIGPVDTLFSLINSKYLQLTQDEPILVERHRASINAIHDSFAIFFQELRHQNDLGILDSLLETVNSELHSLIGIISPDELLTSIFDNYCIGK